MTIPATKNINYTFKMLYIIAIFMVIDGHLGSIDYLNLEGLMRYQNFHLSLFMFASGYFLNPKENPKLFLSKKITKLILPLYGWNIFYGLLCHILNTNFGYSLGGSFNLYNIFIAPLTDGHQFIYNMASWFIVPLFLLQIISFYLLKPFTTQNKNLPLVALIFFIIILSISSIITPNAPSHHGQRDFILLFYRTIYFFPSFAFGYLYRNTLEKYDTLPTPLYLVLTLTAFITLTTLFPNYNHVPSWLDFIFEPSLILFLISFTAILFWLRISKTLSFLVKQSKTLTYISDHTFAIMMHHFIGFIILKNIFSLIFQDVNIHELKSNIWYNYFPFGEEKSSLIILTITLVITLLIDFTNSRFCDIIKRNIKVLVAKYKH